MLKSRFRPLSWLLVVTVLVVCAAADARANIFYVATNGNNTTGAGIANNPWKTLDYAINVGIPADGGHTIRVRPGLYDGLTFIYRSFPNEVVIKSEVDHHAVLTNLAGGGMILGVFIEGDANISIEGFVFTGEGATGPVCTTRDGNMIHFQNASNIRFENNIVFGNNREPFCNDLMKINRSSPPYYPRNIRILGNVFYNHPQLIGSDIIDSERPGELEITGNIFFSDLGVSESENFISLKWEVTGDEVPEDVSSPRYRVNRNIFLNWEGDSGQAMLNFGGDGVSTYEISDALVENNLIVGNSTNPMDAPFQFKGVKGITVRANTVVGDLPSTAFGLLVGTTGLNPTVEDLFIYNNLFSDPTGTMGSTFCLTFGNTNLGTFWLDNNLFWNDGNALPGSGGLLPTADINRIELDPLLETNQQAVVLPKWNTTSRQFESGEVSILGEFERLVETYAALPQGSPAIGAADPANSPYDDIRGWVRDASPDVGAYEAIPPTGVSEPELHSRFSMSQNSPNPFTGSSTFHFELVSAGDVNLALYDVRGRLVRTLLDEWMPEGRHQAALQARGLSGGVYFYRLRVGEREEVKRCVVLR